MKHSLKEILAIFSLHVQHTHEAAVQATYDAGHAAGAEEVKAKLLANDEALGTELMARDKAEKDAADAAKNPTPEGESDDSKNEKDPDATGQEAAKTEPSPA